MSYEDLDFQPFGDMAENEFRKYGHKLVDWIADYLNEIEKYPPLSQVNPSDIFKKFHPPHQKREKKLKTF